MFRHSGPASVLPLKKKIRFTGIVYDRRIVNRAFFSFVRRRIYAVLRIRACIYYETFARSRDARRKPEDHSRGPSVETAAGPVLSGA